MTADQLADKGLKIWRTQAEYLAAHPTMSSADLKTMGLARGLDITKPADEAEFMTQLTDETLIPRYQLRKSIVEGRKADEAAARKRQADIDAAQKEAERLDAKAVSETPAFRNRLKQLSQEANLHKVPSGSMQLIVTPPFIPLNQ